MTAAGATRLLALSGLSARPRRWALAPSFSSSWWASLAVSALASSSSGSASSSSSPSPSSPPPSAPPPSAALEAASSTSREPLGRLEHIDVEVDRAAGIATLRLARPRALNALSSALCEELVGAALGLDADPGVRALVLTGQPRRRQQQGEQGRQQGEQQGQQQGEQQQQQHEQQQVQQGERRARHHQPQDHQHQQQQQQPPPPPPPRHARPAVFAAGADIREMAALPARQARLGRLHQGWRRLAAARLPLVAAVNGAALGGGCELAMMCDIVVASEDAEFGLPEVSLGVIPLMGGTQRLARLCGRAVAMDVALTGRRLTAREALAFGLVSRVVGGAAGGAADGGRLGAREEEGRREDGTEAGAGAETGGVGGDGGAGAGAPPPPPLSPPLSPGERAVLEAQAIARRLAALPARAVQNAKRAVAFAADGGAQGLDAGLDLEERLFHECFATRDRVEGMAAFLERRAPRWRHGG